MKNFIGIDLGTTNSSISSFDGDKVKIWKSPEQNDITPSVIFMNKRTKYYGQRAYDNEPFNSENTAKLFKRFMGTSTKIEFPELELSKTPEECSSEILSVLYGYLPEEMRNSEDTFSVITVPAAFNQIQKAATLKAASMAGIGKVALMQEPIAAVMSVMRSDNSDGIFLIFDLGGGTLDIAIAESIDGSVSLLSHGGIAMCGGRDFDRLLVKEVIKPWLEENFVLPKDFSDMKDYATLIKLCNWAAEKAKIELSSKHNSLITLSENEIRLNDLDGEPLYLDIPIDRNIFNSIIEEYLEQAIDSIRQTLKKVGLAEEDIEKIVFIGGPTNYKPLRDRITSSLNIEGSTELNPMTAVSEGASIFAESIDWDSINRERKRSSAEINDIGELSLKFNYLARTPSKQSRLRISLDKDAPKNIELEIKSKDTGWSSGRIKVEDGTSLELQLYKSGINRFVASVFDKNGTEIKINNNEISITKTAASIDGIPASHSIGVEVLDRLGGTSTLDFIVKEGDLLPKKVKKIFKTSQSIQAGKTGFIKIKIWEGEIKSPIYDNRYIGNLEITGNDFYEGFIPVGADLECEFEILDSGNIVIGLKIPSIGEIFNNKNFYSIQDGKYNSETMYDLVQDQVDNLMARLEQLETVITDEKIQKAKQKVDYISKNKVNVNDLEDVQKSLENVQESKKLLAEVRQEYLKDIRKLDLKKAMNTFNNYSKEYSTTSEAEKIETLYNSASKTIELDNNNFELSLNQIHQINFRILWRQDEFIIRKFKEFENSPHLFLDKDNYRKLIAEGNEMIFKENIMNLRKILNSLWGLVIYDNDDENRLDDANILRG